MAYRDKLRRLCFDGMMLSLSLLLSYLEAVLPLTVWIPLPGFKLGLCNILVTYVFVTVSPFDAAIISLSRISVMGILFGNMASFLFSLAGGTLSYIGLWLAARLLGRFFSMIGISIGCAALHNIGQLLVASVMFGSRVILGYLPMLLVASLIFGGVTGIVLSLLTARLGKLDLNKLNIRI